MYLKVRPKMDVIKLTKHFYALSDKGFNVIEFKANQPQINFQLTDTQ